MDNVTHTLAGLALGRAGLDRLAPRAGLILALAANVPDLDAVAWLVGPLAYLSWHRGVTHGPLGILLLAILPVLAARAVARGPIPWTRSYLLSLAGAATNPLLDWTNTYGVRLLAPFSTRWFQGGFLHIFDLWIWAGLALVLVWPWLARLVSSEIGAKTAPGRGLAIAVLGLLAIYCGGRYLLHQRAEATLDSHIYSGTFPWRVAALPGAVNPFRWTGIVEGESFWSFHQVNLLEEFDPTAGRVFYKPDPSPALEAARRTPEFERYLEFAQYAFWRVTPLDTPEGARRVEAMDLRFGSPSEPRFVVTAVVLAGGRVAGAEFRFGSRERRRGR
jgi:inner membrane protein